MVIDITCDTTVIIKGFVPPRRKKHDEIYGEQLKLHNIARGILLGVEQGTYKLHIPLIAFVEVACVVSRLTNDEESVKLAISFLWQHAKPYPDMVLFERAIKIGIDTKASGFDVLFMACADITNSVLITDDRKQSEKAKEYGLDTKFMRDY